MGVFRRVVSVHWRVFPFGSSETRRNRSRISRASSPDIPSVATGAYSVGIAAFCDRSLSPNSGIQLRMAKELFVFARSVSPTAVHTEPFDVHERAHSLAWVAGVRFTDHLFPFQVSMSGSAVPVPDQ